ncbi:MAG: tRNA lysidine(34) synthetase, partial [Ignavibacterium sp.]
MKSTEQKVIRFITSHSLIKAGEKILVALSGGPDSVFLLYFLKKYQKKFRVELGAFHLNHSLRKSADREQKFCDELCKKLSIPFYTEKVDVKSYAKKSK